MSLSDGAGNNQPAYGNKGVATVSQVTWKLLLVDECKYREEDFSKLITTLTEEELNTKFSDGYGIEEGLPFTAWGENFVFFPIVYAGSEWVGSAPRNPCDTKTRHQGGG